MLDGIKKMAFMAAMTVATAGQGMAQQGGTLSASEFVGILEAMAGAVTPTRYATIQGIGSGTVAPGGSLFGSVSGTNNGFEEDDARIDGSLSVGVGLGNATTGFGSQISLNITSVHPDDFGDSGFLSLKVGTTLKVSGQDIFAAVSLDGLGGWGDSEGMDPRTSVALTRFGTASIFSDTYRVMLTGGGGSHVIDGSEPGLFAGLGVGLTPNFGASLSWFGEYANAGIGINIPQLPGAALAITANDVFDMADEQRLTFSVSYSVVNLF